MNRKFLANSKITSHFRCSCRQPGISTFICASSHIQDTSILKAYKYDGRSRQNHHYSVFESYIKQLNKLNISWHPYLYSWQFQSLYCKSSWLWLLSFISKKYTRKFPLFELAEAVSMEVHFPACKYLIYQSSIHFSYGTDEKTTNFLRNKIESLALDSLAVDEPETLQQFVAGQFDERFNRASVTAGAHPNVMSTVELFADRRTYASIKFTDANGNTIELDPVMGEAFTNCIKGSCVINYLPTNYKLFHVSIPSSQTSQTLQRLQENQSRWTFG